MRRLTTKFSLLCNDISETEIGTGCQYAARSSRKMKLQLNDATSTHYQHVVLLFCNTRLYGDDFACVKNKKLHDRFHTRSSEHKSILFFIFPSLVQMKFVTCRTLTTAQ